SPRRHTVAAGTGDVARAGRIPSGAAALGFERRTVRAPAVRQVIETPRGALLRVLELVTKTADATAARPGSGRRIDSDLQSFPMDVIDQRFHVWKPRVGQDAVVSGAMRTLQGRLAGIARQLPEVVDVDVRPA